MKTVGFFPTDFHFNFFMIFLSILKYEKYESDIDSALPQLTVNVSHSYLSVGSVLNEKGLMMSG